MTTAKEPSRPISQHRLSLGSSTASQPNRRTHSHSVSLGSVSGTHRINRRKSSTFGPSAKPALTAAVEIAVADGSASVKPRAPASRAALGALNDGASSMPQSLPATAELHETAVVDGPSLSQFQTEKLKPKIRRASDGTRLTKKEKNAAGDLKCEHCGKTYKHGSCLHKHRWEHTPQWQMTSKLLISKHQQVQLLEAASVLMNMNAEGSAINDSDNSSSPAASGSSDMRDESSSPETTPPPGVDTDSKRYSGNSSAYSRSYQSIFSDSAHGDDPFTHHRNWSTSTHSRPLTANTSIAESYKDEDPLDLAAAVSLLSCSHGSQGTPRTGPMHLGSDVPPVPPLPEKYQNQPRPQDVEMDLDEDSDDDRQVGMFALDA